MQRHTKPHRYARGGDNLFIRGLTDVVETTRDALRCNSACGSRKCGPANDNYSGGRNLWTIGRGYGARELVDEPGAIPADVSGGFWTWSLVEGTRRRSCPASV